MNHSGSDMMEQSHAMKKSCYTFHNIIKKGVKEGICEVMF